MKSKDFLRSKGILSNDSDHYIIDFHDGREINLGDLLEEYAQQSQPSGMRWVRASDPPKNSNPVYIRYKHAVRRSSSINVAQNIFDKYFV